MRQRIRLIAGLFLLFFAYALYMSNNEETHIAVSIAVAAGVLLYREIIIAVLFVGYILRALGRVLWKRAKKVEETRHCVCCGGIPVYMITTCARVDCAEPIPDVKIFFVCRDHHPNPEIGTKSDELHARIKKTHPGITIERIYPHNPY